MFEKSRLILARKKRGYTQKAFAEMLGISSRHVNSYESGDHVPPDSVVLEMAEKLKFPLQFFFGEEVENIDTDYVSFRAMSKMTAKARDKAIAAADIAMLISDWIEEKFKLPEAVIPDLRGVEPQLAAEALRNEWGLGQKPIKNIIHLLESKGARVFSLTTQPDEIDAFCFWRNKSPYIFINVTKSCERTRFDAAHELGHLVLHRHGVLHGRALEYEADKFASAFLMPATSIISECSGFPKIQTLIEKKSIWGVSLSALVHRLHSVGIISEWHYKQLFIEISKRGYRTEEPNPMEHESSQLLKKVVDILRTEKRSMSQLSYDINVNTEDINALFFGLILTAVQSAEIAERTGSSYAKPSLKLVHS